MPITSRYVVRSTIGLLAVGLVALLFIIGATTWLGERAHRHFTDVIEARDLRAATSSLRAALYVAESSQRGYVLTGNEIYLAPYDNGVLVARTELAGVAKALSAMPERSAMLSRLSEITRDKIDEMEASIALKRADKDAEALAIISTNRGKGLMDEANVFITALILHADERLTASVAEQRLNANWLRWTSIAGAVIIILVVGGVVVTVHRYTGEITAARDEIRHINDALEVRVNERTRELAQARDRAEVLLAEVNHRVANSLTLVSSLVRLQAGAVSDAAAKNALTETQARIQAIAQMHKHLFTSADVGQVAVDQYLSAVLSQLEVVSMGVGSGIKLKCSLEPVTLATNESINLGIIVTEWVTNAFKYAYGDRHGEVRVRLEQREDGVQIVVEDDGIGLNEQRTVQGTGLGTRIVRAIAGSMSAQVSYRDRSPGTEARLVLPRAA